MDVEEKLNRLADQQEKTEVMLARIVHSLQRLERIALSREIRLQDTEAALAALERRIRKPR